MKTKLLIAALMLAGAAAPANAEPQGNVRNAGWWCAEEKGGGMVLVFLPHCFRER